MKAVTWHGVGDIRLEDVSDPSIQNPYDAVDGLQAEYARSPFAHVRPVPLPDSVDDQRAILLSDIVPTGWFGAKLAEVGKGDTVAVLGAGPVGQAAMAVAVRPGTGRRRHRQGRRRAAGALRAGQLRRGGGHGRDSRPRPGRERARPGRGPTSSPRGWPPRWPVTGTTTARSTTSRRDRVKGFLRALSSPRARGP